LVNDRCNHEIDRDQKSYDGYHKWNLKSSTKYSADLCDFFNPLAPGRPILAVKKSQYIPRRPISAASETSFLDRSQIQLLINVGTITAFPGARRTLVLNARGFYISWCTEFGQIFHLNLGARLAIHGSMHNGIL
jgi:hypothetical protein